MIWTIIQARMGSNRLPGKVLKKVCGKPLLELQYERIQRASSIDRIVIATTTETADQEIEKFCQDRNIFYYRGSTEDVLDRYYQAALYFRVKEDDAIVRITADCPLIDPEVIDKVVEHLLQSGVDYVANVDPPTFPDGLDVEVFKFPALKRAWKEARLISEREHVTPYIRNNPQLFSRDNLRNERDFSNMRWTVDEAEDFELVRRIYEELYPRKADFSTDDILNLLARQPYLNDINSKFKRNEGYQKSLEEDRFIK